jgi:hypothetical protein
MPPRSYIITAVVLAVLVAASFPLTLGYSIILWYWLFAAAACILAVAGVIKVANGLRAPLWTGFALAAPGFVWAANKLYEMPFQLSPASATTFNVAAFMALLAAGAGALRLIEMMSRPRAAFRVGYGILAAAALIVGVGLAARAMGWNFTTSALYVAAARALSISAALVKYGAFIGAAVLISLRRNIEHWAGAAISLISAYLLYKAISPMFLVSILGRGDGLMFWLQPVLMLVGGTAVWRMGSVLRAQAIPERPMQSYPLATNALWLLEEEMPE